MTQQAVTRKKINFGYAVKVWSQKREESPTVKRQPVYNFLKRTINHLDIEKQKVKNFTENFIHKFFLEARVNKIRILTLPGITWKFEKDLRYRLGMYYQQRIRVIVTGCEFDYKVFCISAANLPYSKNKSIHPYYSDNVKHYIITNTKEQINLLNIDIFDIINGISCKNLKYDCIWLDTTNTVISISKRLEGLGKILSDNSIVIFTVLKGREHIKFKTNRVDFISEKVKPYGLILAHQKEYFDTCPMLHLIYTKNILMPKAEKVQVSDTTMLRKEQMLVT